jgi:effector-binding domain-containing protein
MIKKILLGLLGLVVLLVIVGFFLPSKLEITKSISINAPAEYAFEEVNTLANWNRWSYWNTLDSAMEITYGEKMMGAGAFYAWNSQNLGQGKLSITESTPFKSIKADLNFMEDGEPSKAWYDFEPEGEGTKLTMGFNSEYGMNPLNRWMGLALIQPEINKAFDHELNKLKELAEAKPKFMVKITHEDIAPFSYIGLKHTMSPSDPNAVSAQMGKMYGELFTAAKKAKVETGQPFCLFPSYSETSMDMVCALPVDAKAKVPAKYKVEQNEGGKAVKATHQGDYKNLITTHEQINKFIAFKKLEIAGAPWEVYVTDPMIEKDTTKWVTEVYYPVKAL